MKKSDVLDWIFSRFNSICHVITFFTSLTSAHAEVTEKWLDRHGFKYQRVLYNKLRGGNYHWIDNHMVHATRFEGKFTDFVLEPREVEVFPKVNISRIF